jgi:hypothetical protein
MMRMESCLRQSSYGQSPRPDHGLETADNLLAGAATSGERPADVDQLRRGAMASHPWHSGQ